MNIEYRRSYSHGSGTIDLTRFRQLGKDVIFEPGALVFHAENIELEDGVYVGHYAILKGYYKNLMRIGAGTWIGQQCFLHSAGGLTIGRAVGIAPAVRILTSSHDGEDVDRPVMHTPIQMAPVVLGDGCDIGVGSIILPGVTIGDGAIVGAGSVVNKDVPPYEVWAGVPARCLRLRKTVANS